MAGKSHIPRLEHMLEEIGHIQKRIADSDPTSLENDWLTRRAVERAFEIISEASRRLPDDLKLRHPDIPWQRVAAIGNRIRHEYDGVNLSLLWKIGQDHIPALERVCKAELAQERRQEIIRQHALKAGRGSRADDRDRDD
jgi:uncharacterized protein with HEPN domain